MKIGIDLLWVRPGICGGTESFIRNLMNALAVCDTENRYLLFAARDNAESFAEYKRYANMEIYVCNTDCSSQPKRILWENLYLDRAALQQQTDLMFIPVYSKPRSRRRSIPYVSVIHDLQAKHYPAYFGAARRLFLQYEWRYTCKTSERIVTDSDFCLRDLQQTYPAYAGKMERIYVPVATSESGLDKAVIEEKYQIRAGEYCYCVSSMLPHKNLETVLKAMSWMKKNNPEVRLVISGVGGDRQTFREKIRQLGIEDNIIDTGFISEEERDCLYENCGLFLFPSIFEGFGMPAVEAMRRGKTVITTDKTSLREVTEGQAIYVDDPLDPKEWAEKILKYQGAAAERRTMEEYSPETVARQYIKLFGRVKEENHSRR